MKFVRKYKLNIQLQQTIAMPAHSKILRLAPGPGLFVEIDHKGAMKSEKRTIVMFANEETLSAVKPGEHLEYIGSFQAHFPDGTDLMDYHVYEYHKINS